MKFQNSFAGKADKAGNIFAVGFSLFQDFQLTIDLWNLDNDRTQAYIAIANTLYAAENTDLIPKEYQSPNMLSAIANVVLQGENNTNDPKVLDIGKAVYKHFILEKVDVPTMDGYSPKQIFVPENSNKN